jgi:hypothetical protein
MVEQVQMMHVGFQLGKLYRSVLFTNDIDAGLPRSFAISRVDQP